MNIIESCEQGSGEWLALRLNKVTASMVSNVISKGRGNAPSKMAETYMIELIAEKLTGKWVTERQWCDFVSFDPRLDCSAGYLQQRVYRDEEYIEEMKVKVYAFVETMNKTIIKLKGSL